MRKYLHFKGDKALWSIVCVVSFLALLPIFSASTNVAYFIGKSDVYSLFMSHCKMLILGLMVLYLGYRIPYKMFLVRGISVLLMLLSILMLLLAFRWGNTINGESAHRWLNLYGIVTLQPSTVALFSLMTFVASYLTSEYNKPIDFIHSVVKFWLPVAVVFSLITLSNLSTGVLIALSVLVVAFVGGYPYLGRIIGAGAVFVVLGYLLIKAFPDAMPNRVQTWENRISDFLHLSTDASTDARPRNTYQIDRAKMAIVSGGYFGKGAGKSIMKNHLSQSSSDFIFAIILEEYGLMGMLLVLTFFCVFLFRVWVISRNAVAPSGKILAVAMGIPIVLQAFMHICVPLGLIPVTGQPLPFITSGGTSILVVYFSAGVLLSISADTEQRQQQLTT